jgi:hypothetical protein
MRALPILGEQEGEYIADPSRLDVRVLTGRFI